MRTLFDKPIRAETTEVFYPNKMTLDQFVDEMRSNIEGFAANGKQLAQPGGGSPWFADTHYIEQWAETFLAWSEIEEECG